MSGYLLWGVVAGGVCIAVHVFLCLAARQSPSLSQAIELILAAVGASGGVKICSLVFTGRLSTAFTQSNVGMESSDIVYVLIGGFALVWLSFETIARRLGAGYSAARITWKAENPPPAGQSQSAAPVHGGTSRKAATPRS